MLSLTKTPSPLDYQQDWLPEFWKPRLEFLKARGYDVTEPQCCWPRKFVQCPKTHQDTAQSFILIAKRIHDEERVMIERLGTSSQTFIVQTTLPKDPQNHCVPILESFEDPLDPKSWSYLVTPVRERHIPAALRIVRDVVCLLDHTLEGLAFLHRNGISRCRCCTSWQISNDARHWLIDSTSRKWYHILLRSAQRDPVIEPVFYLDSVCHPLGEITEDTRDDPHPPQRHRTEEGYFQADVENLALTLRECTNWHVSNIDFVIPLLRAMTKHKVDAQGALAMWQSIKAGLSPQDLQRTLEYGSHDDLPQTRVVAEDNPKNKALPNLF
ncbi:hypothetical protein EIP91_011959 [Steccherinum ochraceum]|uniref:Protein kinase domain-containing protein n=1 Tax=Steccherinum ochraceum TaxID=92696 RepID=A0A4R0RLD5_9APHY|nr:hypothetical protein EIP91_011959 [Steccherinum ochraceum]